MPTVSGLPRSRRAAFLLLALALMSGPASVAQTPTPFTNLRNLSTRSMVSLASGPTITGFVLSGSAPKDILLRASGPGLSFFGIASPLTRPTLTLFDDAGRCVATNTRWGTSSNPTDLQRRSGEMGAFPFASDSADSALLLTLEPGAYTAQITGNTPGIGLLEIYADRQDSPGSRIVNLSSRLQVGTDDAVGIVGLWRVTNRRLLIRAIGPSLASFGVADALSDPILEVIQPEWAGGTRLQAVRFPPVIIARNTRWNSPIEALNQRLLQWSGSPDDIRAATAACGAFPLQEGSNDAAMLVSFNSGETLTMNLQVRGANGGSGTALIEVYEVP